MWKHRSMHLLPDKPLEAMLLRRDKTWFVYDKGMICVFDVLGAVLQIDSRINRLGRNSPFP